MSILYSPTTNSRTCAADPEVPIKEFPKGTEPQRHSYLIQCPVYLNFAAHHAMTSIYLTFTDRLVLETSSIPN